MFRKRKPEPQARQAAKPTVKLTAAEKREISRILETARGDGKVHSAQDTLPFRQMYPDGLCKLDDHTWSKCIEFEDVNYQLAKPDDQTAIFEALCDMYNAHDASIGIQLSLVSRRMNREDFVKRIEIAAQGDHFDHIRELYTQMLRKQLERGNNGLIKTKYLTLTIEARDSKTARARFSRIVMDALNHFKVIRWEYIDTSKRNPASLATLPKVPKVRRKVWSIQTFRQAVQAAEDDLLSICMHLAFSCSMRIGEITGLTWEDVIIDEESIATDNARVIINKELSRVNAAAMQKLKEKDIIKIFPTQKPHCTTRLVLKTPKTETSNRTVWLPRTVAQLLVQYKKDQQELKEFLGSAYNDYNLVIALENGNPVESRIVRDRFQKLCEENDFEIVVFHSLRHLSTGYKLKMTNGDVKSVQGDTGHAEAEMVTDVYSKIIDEDRRFNAQKMDKEFYSTLDEDTSNQQQDTGISDSDMELLKLLKSLSPEMKEQLLKQTLNK